MLSGKDRQPHSPMPMRGTLFHLQASAYYPHKINVKIQLQSSVTHESTGTHLRGVTSQIWFSGVRQEFHAERLLLDQTNYLRSPYADTHQLNQVHISFLLDHTPAIDYSHLSIGLHACEWMDLLHSSASNLVGRKHSRHDCSVCLNRAFQNFSIDLQKPARYRFLER